MKNDVQKILLVFLGTVAAVYGLPRLGLPNIILQGIFLLIIAYVYNSKDNIFWLSWFFVITNAPGRLFMGGVSAAYSGLPAYNILPGITLGFSDLFLIMYIFKILLSRKQNIFMFKREMWLFIGIGLIYFAMSFALGISFAHIVDSMRTISMWFWIFIISHYIIEQKDLQRFFMLIMPFAILALVAVIQTYITGSYLGDILGQRTTAKIFEASEESLARVYSSAILNITCMILSVYFLARKNTRLNPNLLILVILVSFLNVFLSATRGWILFMLILFSSFFFIQGFGLFKQVVRFIVILGLLFVVLAIIYPNITSQLLLSYERFLTLEFLAEGDLTAGGTLQRLTVRGPRVMAAWRESPIIGWGFSDMFYAYADGHVGNQTNLLNLGIIGFIAIHLIYLSFFFKTYRFGRRNEIKKIIGNAPIVFLFALVALFLAHSSSGALWGLFTRNGFFWGIILSAINVELNPALNKSGNESGFEGEIA